MSKALVFADESALLVALEAGWIPPAVAAAPVETAIVDGAIHVVPSAKLDEASRKRLRAHGVGEEKPKATLRSAGSWVELVEPRRRKDAGVEAATMFFDAPLRSVSALSGEMLRLGCDRQELRTAGDRALLRVVAPPYFVVAKALDHLGDVRVLRSVRPGERVLLEVGLVHPLLDRTDPVEGTVLLVTSDGFRTIADGPFEDLDRHLDVEVGGRPARLEIVPTLPRVSVPLRLSRAPRRTDASAFVVRERAVDRVSAFARSAPSDVLEGLSFAVIDGAGGEPAIVLRARADVRMAASPVEGAEAYAPHPQVLGLLVPADATLEPPLRRERLEKLLHDDPTVVTFVRQPPDEAARVVAEQLPESSFRPLVDFVDYLVDRGAAVLRTWIESVTFDFAPFVVVDPPRGERDEAPPDDERRPRRRARERDDEADDARAEKARDEAPIEAKGKAPRAKAAAKKASKAVGPEPAVAIPVAAPSDDEAALRALEDEFLALDVGADDPRRLGLFREMATVLRRRGRGRDAALCLVRALWEAPAEEQQALARAWAESEEPGGRARAMARTTAGGSSTADGVRATASWLVADTTADGAPRPDVAQLAAWLGRHDDVLDVRTQWLAHRALALGSGGDRLALARSRDRVLARLSGGLSVERDVPSFLRFVGQNRGGVGAAKLAGELDALLPRLERSPRKRGPVEAAPAKTGAYLRYVVAYGLGRLGEATRARELAKVAAGMLDRTDAVHAFLAKAFEARVAQAIDGVAAGTPLPADLAGELNELERFARYKVDRLRQSSLILEPQERLDPIAAFHRRENDPRGDALAPLRGLDDREALGREVEKVVEHAATGVSSEEERARLLDGVLDFFPLVGEPRAIGLLPRVVASARTTAKVSRAQLLEESLRVAGHYGHAAMVRSILDELAPLLGPLVREHPAETTALLGGMLRALRRLGLREEAAMLVETAAVAAAGESLPDLIARVHLAGGQAFLGREEVARPVLERAIAHLGKPLAIGDRLLLVRALTSALGHASEGLALPALRLVEADFVHVTDAFNTNSHFCLSVVAFAECLVLGLASDELALGPVGRRYLDDDEYLVRRRIHRDLRELGG